MKVILLKDTEQGKKNEIIDVSAGYAMNFIIKKGLGVPVNKDTTKSLNKRLNTLRKKEDALVLNASKIKSVIEKIELHYKLKVTNDVIHGSITRKQIVNSLKSKGVHLDPHSFENVKINTLGTTNIKVSLHKNVIAELSVKVENE